jgi:hypothetical protein
MTETKSIDTTKLASDILNAVVPHVITGSQTVMNYQLIHSKMLASFAAFVTDSINKKEITDAEARHLLRDQETIESVHILAVDVIKESTKAKAVMALLKVVQTAVNTATGLSLAIF